MGRRVLVVAIATLVFSGCGREAGPALESLSPGSSPAANGDDAEPAVLSSWRLVSLEIDGEPFPIDRPLFLDITEDGFHAATTCNFASGTFGSQVGTTLMACLDETATAGERYMTQAFATEPAQIDGQLIFDDGNVRLVYEAFIDPRPSDLFTVLGDPSSAVDESVLPSEQVTGTVPPDFDALVSVPSPSSDVDLFLADFDGHACVVYGTATELDTWCQEPRFAAETSTAVNIPIHGAPLFRLALIPDRFAPAMANRPDLGTYTDNILVVSDDAPEGNHSITDASGETFVPVVPPGPIDPMPTSAQPGEPAESMTPAQASAVQLSTSVFTTDYGCRWEFATGDEQGTWHLHIAMPDQGPIPSGHINLDDSSVIATVTAGRDLFSNYCDDLVEPGEPDPVPLEEWPVVAGAFDMPAYDPNVTNSLTITLRDAVVDTEAGPVHLGPIEITNGCFGCQVP